MSEWRYTAYDLRTGEKLTDLQVQSWDSTDELEGVGSWSATVELDGMAATATTARRSTVADSLRCGRTLVVAERDGVPVFSGIVWRRQYDARSRMLRVAGAGMLSFWDHWITPRDWTYTAQDQFVIARSLLGWTNNLPGGNIGINFQSGSSGVLRDRTYYADDGLKLGELVRNLSDVINGFDYTARVEYHSGVPEKWVRFWYPRRGRDLSVTNLRFRAPGNAVLFDMNDDGTELAVTVRALGAGDGDDMLVTTASRTDMIDSGWPGYTTQRSYKDVKERVTLANHAEADVEHLSGVDGEVYTVQVDPSDVGQPYGSWDLGDDCLLIVDDDPMFPAGDDGTPGLVSIRRVGTHRWRNEGAAEELTVGLIRKVIV